jgi:NAD(P)-dependent dehydrogenase (short-subunit alcohol dehydrogenase family)
MVHVPTALVTGGNRGLGFETSKQLAEQGYRVLLTARKLEDAERAAHDLRGNITPLALDVTDRESTAALVREVARLGRIDALVNNAGASLKGFNAEVARNTLATNFFGPMQVTDALLPQLTIDARVVMVSSRMGELSVVGSKLRQRFAQPDLARRKLLDLVIEFVAAVERGDHQRQGWPSNAYSMSKLALNALTRVLSRELHSTGIRVNAVCPGWVHTRMGGHSATRSPQEGARGIVWAAMLPASGPTGGFFRDEQPAEW